MSGIKEGLEYLETEVLLVEPPPASDFGNMRTLGSIGSSKADICWPPLDLMIISGFLEKNGISTFIFDASANRSTFDEIREVIAKKNPRLVVFTTSVTTIYNDLKVAEVAKSVSKDIFTAAFGSSVTALPEDTLDRNINLDFAVYSEPELVIFDLIKENYSPANILGLCYRCNNRYMRNSPHPKCLNLDDFGFPTHDKIPIPLYRDPTMRRSPMTLVMGQRGCINDCTYCPVPLYQGGLRQRSVEHVIEELQWIVELGIKEIRFFDCGLTNDIKWANHLFDEMIEHEIDLTWVCNTRADRISLELLKKMKEAGCHMINIGGESGDLEILKRVRKNITPEMVEEAVSAAKKVGINTAVFFMLGLPGETKETMKKTIAFAKRIDPDIVTFNIATPHTGTPY